MMPRKYKAGQRFGRLVIASSYSTKRGSRWFHDVICDCGNKKTVGGDDIGSGKVSSCGCYRKEKVSTHGMSKRPEYRIWASMMQRCTNDKDAGYKNYGARGVGVTKEWLSFKSFIKDMGFRKDRNLTLERVDNNLGYSKGNCVWADRSTQSINQRGRTDNKTGQKGVSLAGSRGYTATIQRNKKRIYLGTFRLLSDAIDARLAAEKQPFKG